MPIVDFVSVGPIALGMPIDRARAAFGPERPPGDGTTHAWPRLGLTLDTHAGSDAVYLIELRPPFRGCTTLGVALGDPMSRALALYSTGRWTTTDDSLTWDWVVAEPGHPLDQLWFRIDKIPGATTYPLDRAAAARAPIAAIVLARGSPPPPIMRAPAAPGPP